ncbi:MAG TPA: hypothetical protein VKY40_04645 [Halanaerobiales bacterium]|nr:hypothetical protein [Halanaerobiales bacterium]
MMKSSIKILLMGIFIGMAMLCFANYAPAAEIAVAYRMEETTEMSQLNLIGAELNLEQGNFLLESYAGINPSPQQSISQFLTEVNLFYAIPNFENYYIGAGFTYSTDDYRSGPRLYRSVQYVRLRGINNYNKFRLATEFSYAINGTYRIEGIEKDEIGAYNVGVRIDADLGKGFALFGSAGIGKEFYSNFSSNNFKFSFGINYFNF